MREEEKKEREKREKKRKEMETELQQKIKSLEEEKSKLEEANSGGAAKIELLEKKNEEAIQAAASLRQELDDMAVAKLQLNRLSCAHYVRPPCSLGIDHGNNRRLVGSFC